MEPLYTDFMRITTETGSVYEIDDGLCIKKNAEGERIDAFKVWVMKPVPDDITTWEEIHDLPQGEPEVGKRLYLAGRDVFWISTQVVSVKYED